MPKHPCHVPVPRFDLCTSTGFYLQQICGQGHLDKYGCSYTIHTECGGEFTNTGAVRHLETLGDPLCTPLFSCGYKGLSVRVKIPVLLYLSSCGGESTEKGYIEETVPLKIWGSTENLWRCRMLANARVRQKEINSCCAKCSSLFLHVHIEVFVLCGCIVRPSHPCPCPEPKPWYPPLSLCHQR